MGMSLLAALLRPAQAYAVPPLAPSAPATVEVPPLPPLPQALPTAVPSPAGLWPLPAGPISAGAPAPTPGKPHLSAGLSLKASSNAGSQGLHPSFPSGKHSYLSYPHDHSLISSRLCSNVTDGSKAPPDNSYKNGSLPHALKGTFQTLTRLYFSSQHIAT